jgi:TrwC relaxase
MGTVATHSHSTVSAWLSAMPRASLATLFAVIGVPTRTSLLGCGCGSCGSLGVDRTGSPVRVSSRGPRLSVSTLWAVADLHTHVAVANKVQTLDGRWLSIHRSAVQSNRGGIGDLQHRYFRTVRQSQPDSQLITRLFRSRRDGRVRHRFEGHLIHKRCVAEHSFGNYQRVKMFVVEDGHRRTGRLAPHLPARHS